MLGLLYTTVWEGMEEYLIYLLFIYFMKEERTPSVDKVVVSPTSWKVGFLPQLLEMIYLNPGSHLLEWTWAKFFRHECVSLLCKSMWLEDHISRYSKENFPVLLFWTNIFINSEMCLVNCNAQVHNTSKCRQTLSSN